MKKAYVKPVFLAEEFEGTASVAACEYRASHDPLEVWNERNICSVGDNGHFIGKVPGASVNKWWEYATEGMANPQVEFTNPTSNNFDAYNDTAYLFTDGQTVCDFVWNGMGSQVGIWTSEEGNVNTSVSDHTKRDGLFVTLIDAFNTFFGIEPKNEQHEPGLKNQKFFS